ncbi:hypothetical protein [uncultured Nostoc sp.]|uniref:hypothetical protein n=1 Tax=uncultured Nostoc sp. TaxID=340711 RepID=UPI0035CC22E9
MDINPNQFASLDYSNADMYSGLNQRPPTATPLNIPLENFADKTPSKNQSPLEQAYRRDEEIRRQSLFKEQQETQKAAELALREREIARNKAALGLQPNNPEQPIVSSRDYEKKFKAPFSSDTQQSPPSTGSPPPTAKGTAARANPLIEPTATPAPVMLKEAVSNTVANAASALPRALPQAAGRLVVPGVTAGVTFGARVIVGQSVVQAASGAIVATAGSIVGGIAGTAIAGPIGGVIGAAIGGYVGGAISDAFFQSTPSAAEVPETPLNYPPFQGGQGVGIQYNAIDKGMRQSQIDNLTEKGQGDSLLTFTGPILSMTVIAINPQHEIERNGVFYAYYITRIVTPTETRDVPFFGGFVRWVNRYPNAPVSGDPIQPAPPPDNLPYRYNASSIGENNTVPPAKPTTPGKRGKTRNVAPSLPSNNTPNGAPFFPGHGGLAPSYTPNPTQTPSNLGGLLPAISPIKQPLPFAEPDDIPIARSLEISSPVGTSNKQAGNSEQFPIASFPNSPTFPIANVRYDSQGNVLPTDINGNKPFEFTATPLEANPIRPNALSSSNPVTSRAEPVPDAQSSIPKANSAPKTQTPTETAARQQAQNSEDTKKAFDNQITRLTAIATAIAALTPAIKGIPDAIAKSPTVQAANKETTQTAVCEIAQPTGCLGAPIKKAEDAAKNNGNKLDELNAALGAGNAGANAAQLALLETINNKLGEQVLGGISGFMNRIVKNQWVDRAINLITMTAAIHNVIMLSDQAVTTFFSILDNVLAIPALIVDPNAETIDTKQAFGGVIDNFFKNIFGVSEWTEIKTRWATANRIYQAAANGANEVRNIGGNIISAVEQTAQLTGKGFNAMQDEGLLSEANWDYSPESLKLKGGLFAKFGKLADGINIATEGLEAIESITSEIRSAVDSANQIKENAKEVDDGLKELFNQSKTKREEEVEALPAKNYSWEDLT